MINEEQLKAFAPAANPALLPIVVKWFNEYADKYQVNTPQRIAAFLAQLIHESGSFKYTREIASGEAYEGRADLGNIHKGDGVKFKGRGLIQITGRKNYGWISKDLFNDDTLLKNPDLLAAPQYAMQSAFWFWDQHALNKYADMPISRKLTIGKHENITPFQVITLLINGGFTNLQDRINNYNRICGLLVLPKYP